MGTPSGGVTPGARQPEDPEAPTTPSDDDPAPEKTPDDDPKAAPPKTGSPETGGDGPTPVDPAKPPTPGKRGPGGGVTGRRKTGGGPSPWRLWWEYNRVHLVGLRGLLREGGPITGARVEPKDRLAKHRGKARDALRLVAQKETDRTLRAAAILALGRIGGDREAVLFLNLLDDDRLPADVHEAAALALGLLPPIEDASVRASTRKFLEYSMRHHRLPERARGFAIVAAGLRANSDKKLMMALVERCSQPVQNQVEGAHIALACGASRDRMVTPELVSIARRGRFGRRMLGDVARSHAVTALAWTGDPFVVKTLVDVVRSRSTGLETRRSATLALGKLLRQGLDDKELATRAGRALIRAFEKGRDPVLRGYCAVSLGGAKEPQGVHVLREAIDGGGPPVIRSFAALGLGLAARHADAGTRYSIGSFLQEELRKTKEVEFASVLCIALGLGTHTGAADELIDRADSKTSPATLRAAAAQGLGLMGKASPKTDMVLFHLLQETNPVLVEDAALALGLLGRGSATKILLHKLAKTESTRVRGGIILALGHLGNPATVDPLLEILSDRTQKTVVREYAAVALGLVIDTRSPDVLFEIDADFNLFATTVTTNELIRLY